MCRGGRYSFPGLLYFTLDPYLIMLSVKQGGIKYHFLSLWYDSTWDWTQVSRAIGEHSNLGQCSVHGIYGTIILLRIFDMWYIGIGICEIICLIWLPCLWVFYFTIYVSGFVVSTYFCLYNGSNFCFICCDNFVNVFFMLVGGAFDEFLKLFFLFCWGYFQFFCCCWFYLI